MVVFCFFKQKTAYEMRISDWSSDVCSSDLGGVFQRIRRWQDGDIRGLPARRVQGRGGGRSAAQQCRCQCDVACLRSEARRVGKECVSTFSSKWCPYHSNKNHCSTFYITLTVLKSSAFVRITQVII